MRALRTGSAVLFLRSAGLDLRPRALVATVNTNRGNLFASFFQAGFECSSHRRRDGVRLDLIRATGHDKHVLQRLSAVPELGLSTIRDGLRWHLIEKSPGQYDWSSWLPALEAAEKLGLQVIWDLFHYGSPDHIDQAGDDFPDRFTEFAIAAVEVQQSVSRRPPLVCPLERDQLHVVGGRGRLFPACRAGRSGLVQTAAGSSGNLCRNARSTIAGPRQPSSGPSP